MTMSTSALALVSPLFHCVFLPFLSLSLTDLIPYSYSLANTLHHNHYQCTQRPRKVLNEQPDETTTTLKEFGFAKRDVVIVEEK
eukprot:m.157358 g.157358  ORF g.157358 m.157358 type:complete len:84 (-) comp31052_c3_seq2:79-330(-)